MVRPAITWLDRLSEDERTALVALLGAASALRLDEVRTRAGVRVVHDDLMALHAHGLVAHTPDGWGLTPLGRDVAILVSRQPDHGQPAAVSRSRSSPRR